MELTIKTFPSIRIMNFPSDIGTDVTKIYPKPPLICDVDQMSQLQRFVPE